jgi:hypothetical protein
MFLAMLFVAAVGCTTEPSGHAPHDASRPHTGPHDPGNAQCGADQDACMTRCKAAAPDEASRQPCYNGCLRDSQRCGG